MKILILFDIISIIIMTKYEFNIINENEINKCCIVAIDNKLNKLHYIRKLVIYGRQNKLEFNSNLNKNDILEKIKKLEIYCVWCNHNIELNLKEKDTKNTNLLSTKKENSNVYPFINELVDSLFNDELNSIIDKNTEINSDKSVFMMFVNIYFMAYLHTQQSQNDTQKNVSDEERKNLLKEMLTDVIRCPEKRQVCVSLIKQINPLFNIDSVITNTLENTKESHLLKED